MCGWENNVRLTHPRSLKPANQTASFFPVNQLSLHSAQPLRTCDCLFFPLMDRHNFCLSAFTTSPQCSLWSDSEGTDLQKCQTVVSKVTEREDDVFLPEKEKKKAEEASASHL